MKIYHEEYEGVNEIDQTVDCGLKNLSGEYKPLIERLSNMVRNLFAEKMYYAWEMRKYKIMWTLRHLETEINAEGGVLIITGKGDLELKEFSAELSFKIKEAIEKSNKV